MTAFINIVGFPFLNLTTDTVAEMVQNQSIPLKLKEEPENQFDQGAIALYRGFDRIGYVAKDSQEYVRHLLSNELKLTLETKFPRSLKIKVESH